MTGSVAGQAAAAAAIRVPSSAAAVSVDTVRPSNSVSCHTMGEVKLR